MIRRAVCFATFAISGIAAASVAVPVMGIVMAVAIPSQYFSWFVGLGEAGLGHFIADVAMIAPTIGLFTAALLLLIYRFVYPATAASVLAFLLGAFVTTELVVPVLYGVPFAPYAHLPWHAYALHIVITAAATFAFYIARRLGHNYSFKRTCVPHAA